LAPFLDKSEAPDVFRVRRNALDPGDGDCDSPDGVLAPEEGEETGCEFGAELPTYTGMRELLGLVDKPDNIGMFEIEPDLSEAGLAMPEDDRAEPFRVFLEEKLDLVEVGVRLGILLLEAPSSVLSNDKFEPCLLGGLLPGRLAGRLFPLLPGKLPPFVRNEIGVREAEAVLNDCRE